MTGEIFLIAELMVKQMRGELQEQERMVLDDWLSKDGNRALWEKLSDDKELSGRLGVMHDIDTEAAKRKAYAQLFPGVIPMGERKQAGWKKWMAAASVLVVVMGVLWVSGIFNNKELPAITDIQPAIKQDVNPAKGSVVLLLADGNRVVLDSAGQGAIAQQGNVSIIKKAGGIQYDAKQANDAVYLNTLQTEKGKQYSVQLADGSRVWLNAASSLTYPSAFPGKERKVTIDGEAYFEIAKNAAKPFIVETGDMQVEVLGTHFNVMAYANEPGKKTTLIEGSVRVREKNQSVLLQPGAQAVVAANSAIAVIKDADTEEAIAWKNGIFQFQNASLDVVLRNIQRWYDVQVVYDGSINRGFYFDIGRDVPLSKLLHLLELTGTVKFRLENNILTVIPGK